MNRLLRLLSIFLQMMFVDDSLYSCAINARLVNFKREKIILFLLFQALQVCLLPIVL